MTDNTEAPAGPFNVAVTQPPMAPNGMVAYVLPLGRADGTRATLILPEDLTAAEARHLARFAAGVATTEPVKQPTTRGS